MGYDDVQFHRSLIGDHVRTEAYQRALQQVVRPGAVVLDVGTGSGVLALLAARAGAGRVYAVEQTPVIGLARKLAQANGLTDTVTFLEGDVRSIALPERVDVVVSELLSKAFLGQALEAITRHCRERFLAPGGRFVPERVELIVAPITDAPLSEALGVPPPARYGLDFSPLAQATRNTVHGVRLSAGAALAPPAVAHRYDALATDGADRVDAELPFEVARVGVLHGFGAWFHARLAGDVVLGSDPPGIPSWDNAFFPLAEPLAVAPGDTIDLSLVGVDVGGAPTWSWSTTVRTGPTVRARFSQSTFLAAAAPPRGR